MYTIVNQAQKVHPEGLWMSSSEEILLFRRVLLNPVTSQQFQYFVSLKGGFLENDVRFWVEVQRYKVKDTSDLLWVTW